MLKYSKKELHYLIKILPELTCFVLIALAVIWSIAKLISKINLSNAQYSFLLENLVTISIFYFLILFSATGFHLYSSQDFTKWVKKERDKNAFPRSFFKIIYMDNWIVNPSSDLLKMHRKNKYSCTLSILLLFLLGIPEGLSDLIALQTRKISAAAKICEQKYKGNDLTTEYLSCIKKIEKADVLLRHVKE